MSTSTLRIVIAIVFIVHGVGHYMGILSAFGVNVAVLVALLLFNWPPDLLNK